jgi:hypothetical protein
MSEDKTIELTPLTSSKKRPVSSPIDLLESKKHKQIDNLESVDEIMANTSEKSKSILAKEDLLCIAETVKNSLKYEIRDITHELLDKKFDEFTKRVTDGIVSSFNKQIEDLETNNRKLSEKIGVLEAKLDQAEQYSRRNNLRISGIVESDDEDTDSKVLNIASKLGLKLSINEIDRSHRVGPKQTKNKRDILVKFTNYHARNNLFKSRVKCKNNDMKGIFINEDLTRARSNLLYQARQIVKRGSAESAWSHDGTILIRDKAKNVRRINKEDDLKIFENTSGGLWRPIDK